MTYASRRPLAIPLLLCAAALSSLLLVRLSNRNATPAFTVNSLPPTILPGALDQRTSRAADAAPPAFEAQEEALFGTGQLGSSGGGCGTSASGEVMSKSRNAGNKADFLYNKDRGYQVGEEAYQHPPAVPDASQA
eukprot:CAMPEP_0115119382 /NCGR_PEP_ID=MMETSP0227-20121206/45057_1 /TAXON_ID=89957 /ORGANISM="Polarella glacialis, Strain CCMP 1383" /LENGTH=134 /DNA_ID=CAMNT_0002520839 /DNA_START=74 /DNA_END=479 /DNA_ORIENTATION=+